jgi:uncharacterized membrane protein YbaN (DUF454 family)
MDDRDDDIELHLSATVRYLLLALGWLFLALGALGAFLPVLPTVPFLLVTAWAWARSSKRLHRWLYRNPTYGPYLVAWDKYGAIPRRAKHAAVALMAGGWLVFAVFFASNWWVPALIAVVQLGVAAFILTRPDAAPDIR